MAVRPKRNYDITALQRGLRLLSLFSESPRGLTAKQVAASSRLPVSTVHRFLANLVTAGFLNRDLEGTHHLGIACFAIGCVSPALLHRCWQSHAGLHAL